MQFDRSWKMGVMAAAVMASAAGAVAGSPAATFWNLGDLPGGPTESYASVVSDDGQVVAGDSSVSSSRRVPYRWTSGSGIAQLDSAFFATIGGISGVTDMSPNGSVMIGSYDFTGFYDDFGVPVQFTAKHGYYWTAATGAIDIPNSVAPGRCEVSCMTADGQTLFGTYQPVVPGSLEGGTWTAANGWAPLPGPFPAAGPNEIVNVSGVFSCSSDGSAFIGMWDTYNEATFRSSSVPFLRNANGFSFFPSLDGDACAGVAAISDDGTTVVGFTASTKPYRWTAAGGAQAIGLLPGHTKGSASAVSGDGSIIGGSSQTNSSSSQRAFIWDAVNGTRNLKDVAIAAGATGLEDWTLRVVADISADGRYIAGWGKNGSGSSVAYLIDLGATTPACPADFNGDNVRDVADLFGYINAWLAKTGNADFNHDTIVDVADLFGYINAWLAGC